MEIQLLQVGGQKPAKTTMPAIWIWVVFFKYAIYISFSLLLVVQKSGKLTSWGNGSLSQYLQGFSTIPDGCLICLAFLPSTVVLWLNDSCTFYSQTYLVFFQHFCRRSTDLKPTYTPLKHWKPAYGLSNKKTIPKDPWDWYIHLHEWLLFMGNVGKYTSPMDPMGIKSTSTHLKPTNPTNKNNSEPTSPTNFRVCHNHLKQP